MAKRKHDDDDVADNQAYGAFAQEMTRRIYQMALPTPEALADFALDVLEAHAAAIKRAEVAAPDKEGDVGGASAKKKKKKKPTIKKKDFSGGFGRSMQRREYERSIEKHAAALMHGLLPFERRAHQAMLEDGRASLVLVLDSGATALWPLWAVLETRFERRERLPVYTGDWHDFAVVSVTKEAVSSRTVTSEVWNKVVREQSRSLYVDMATEQVHTRHTASHSMKARASALGPKATLYVRVVSACRTNE